MESAENITAQVPMVARVLGEDWIRRSEWMSSFVFDRLPWYERLEGDLSTLASSGIPEQRLIQVYRDQLRVRKEIQNAIYEVHAAALFAKVGRLRELHAPRGDGSNRNYDIAAEIEGNRLAIECKTRKDEFPFNMPPEGTGEAGELYGGSRGTLDPHDAARLGFNVTPSSDSRHKATPESTVLKQTLALALSQVPADGFNIIVIGQIDGDIHNLEEALFGTEYVEMRRNINTGETTTHWLRAPNGAFNDDGEEFDSLSAVLWVRLRSEGDELKGTYRGCLNPRAKHPLHEKVVARLRTITEKSA